MTNEELVKLYQDGNRNALEKLIENNMGIIHKMANKFYTYHSNVIDKEDLIQEGLIGIITAAEKYDFNNPHKASFITYCVHWIYQRLYKFVVGHSTKGIENNKLNNNCTSLNTPVGEGRETELEELIEDKDYGFENKEEQIYLEQLRKDLEQAMIDYTTLQEREILKFRFGWDVDPMTYREIEELLKLSRFTVRQADSRALRKLRKSKWARLMHGEYLEYGYIR